MDVTAGDVVAALVGVGGLVLAIVANRRARNANEAAKASNEIATEAVAKADEANRIAEHANQLSLDANTVIKRQAAQQEEQWLVEWSAKWYPDRAVLALTNDGRDVAIQPTVLVRGENLNELSEGHQDAPRRYQLEVPLAQIAHQRADHATRTERRRRQMSEAGIISVGTHFKNDVVVTVQWRTGLGKPQQQIIECRLQ
jgi:hypothetical protein